MTSKFDSKHGIVSRPPFDLYMAFTDMRNFVQMLPEDKREGVTADFVLHEGPVSILRIDTARGKTRLFYEEGQAVPMEKKLSGTYAKVIFKHHISKVIDTVVYTGVAHHVIMGYVQYGKAMLDLARIMGWEVIDADKDYFSAH